MYFLHYDSETVNNNIIRNSDVYVDNSEGGLNGPFKLLHVETKPLGCENQYSLKMSGDGKLASWYNLKVTSTRVEASKRFAFIGVLAKIVWWIVFIYTTICAYMISDLYEAYQVEPGDYQILAVLYGALLIAAYMYDGWNKSTEKILELYMNNFALGDANVELMDKKLSDMYHDTMSKVARNRAEYGAEVISDELKAELSIESKVNVEISFLIPSEKRCDSFLAKKNLSDPVAGLKEAVSRCYSSDDPEEEWEDDPFILLDKMEEIFLLPLGNDVCDALTSILSYSENDDLEDIRKTASEYYNAVEDEIGRPYAFYRTAHPLTEKQKRALGAVCHMDKIDKLFVAEYHEYLMYVLIYDKHEHSAYYGI